MKMTKEKPRIIAFYLPQYHPIPENDEWWGKGFTEWTNVARARPLFPGHYQPRIPADLGFYDLRVSEVRERQAELARNAGIDGFCYWHYWFDGGRRLLERPFNEVLASGKPDFPFCLAWANESWYAKLWDKDARKDRLLIEQTYRGESQYERHFHDVLPAFKDRRYIKVDGKPVFMIYKPLASSEIPTFIATWRRLAAENGLPGIYFIAHCNGDRKNISAYRALDVDAVNTFCLYDYRCKRNFLRKSVDYLYRHLLRKPYIVPYKRASKFFFDKNTDCDEKTCPSIITGWDHTPRSGNKGTVFTNETPAQFGLHADTVIKNTKGKFIFIKSWNEWAEGNYLEPDLKWGLAFLDVLKNVIVNSRLGGVHQYSIELRRTTAAIRRCA